MQAGLIRELPWPWWEVAYRDGACTPAHTVVEKAGPESSPSDSCRPDITQGSAGIC